MRCHLTLSSMSHPIPYVPNYKVPCSHPWGTLSPPHPPYLSEGDSMPKSKLSSVTNRTSAGTLGVSPGLPCSKGETPGTCNAGAAVPRSSAIASGHWGHLRELGGSPPTPSGSPTRAPTRPPCPQPPAGARWHRSAPGDSAGARRRRARCHRDGDAPPAPVGGGDTGDPHPGNPQPSTPSPGVLSATMGGPSPAPRPLRVPSATMVVPSPCRGTPAQH